MTDLATATTLELTPTQLPLSWYFDPAIAEIEQRTLFATGPGYVGNELMVPNVGDYYALDWLYNGKALVRDEAGVALLSNVCRHRQSIILKGRGNTRNIVCPLHRWTYDLQGKLLGAPEFPNNPCLDLERTPLSSWNGMLFSGAAISTNICQPEAVKRAEELARIKQWVDRTELLGASHLRVFGGELPAGATEEQGIQ